MVCFGAMRCSIALLKDKRIACNMLDRWQHLLREKDVAVILAVDFHSGVDNSVIPIFDTAMETITDLEKLYCVHSKTSGCNESGINLIPVTFFLNQNLHDK